MDFLQKIKSVQDATLQTGIVYAASNCAGCDRRAGVWLFKRRYFVVVSV
jgi:hypothetical protein